MIISPKFHPRRIPFFCQKSDPEWEMIDWMQSISFDDVFTDVDPSPGWKMIDWMQSISIDNGLKNVDLSVRIFFLDNNFPNPAMTFGPTMQLNSPHDPTDGLHWLWMHAILKKLIGAKSMIIPIEVSRFIASIDFFSGLNALWTHVKSNPNQKFVFLFGFVLDNSLFPLLDKLVDDIAKENNVVVISPLGTKHCEFPADCDRVISVGKIDCNRKKYQEINVDDEVDVYAPGINIEIEEGLDTQSGTAISAAIIASVCARIWAINHELNGEDVKSILKSTPDKIIDFKFCCEKALKIKKMYTSDLHNKIKQWIIDNSD